jgi:hypothetical protein
MGRTHGYRWNREVCEASWMDGCRVCLKQLGVRVWTVFNWLRVEFGLQCVLNWVCGCGLELAGCVCWIWTVLDWVWTALDWLGVEFGLQCVLNWVWGCGLELAGCVWWVWTVQWRAHVNTGVKVRFLCHGELLDQSLSSFQERSCFVELTSVHCNLSHNSGCK